MGPAGDGDSQVICVALLSFLPQTSGATRFPRPSRPALAAAASPVHCPAGSTPADAACGTGPTSVSVVPTCHAVYAPDDSTAGVAGDSYILLVGFLRPCLVAEHPALWKHPHWSTGVLIRRPCSGRRPAGGWTRRRSAPPRGNPAGARLRRRSATRPSDSAISSVRFSPRRGAVWEGARPPGCFLPPGQGHLPRMTNAILTRLVMGRFPPMPPGPKTKSWARACGSVHGPELEARPSTCCQARPPWTDQPFTCLGGGEELAQVTPSVSAIL